MPTIINGTTGIDKVQDGSVSSADLASGVALSNLGTAQLASDNMPAGSVLQVVGATYSTSSSTTSTSFVNTGLTANITPKSASNKILVIVNFMGYATTNANWIATITRGSTNLGNLTWGMGTIYNSAGGVQGAYGLSYLDSPATTASTTYSLAYRKDGGTAYICFNGEQASITLLEIAG
jgi:hypothetical protein